ncbi:GNAT family N-acetyltransferase [Chitinophaga arvensicola]|uniref:Putative acetyltransferase n=1 Tax=Chitinophaga arvensicola TaxID=29529 RepID=A0A1I0S563_9BACT|nr:GNAT family N-acetyltransferase [Chitinophaga arvensicola]SEW50025.1 putative acetyltransferase [Chitinophaga arvensicola]
MKHQIESVEEAAYPEIVAVWEASVTATHDFLTPEDIAFFKPLILNEYLKAVELSCIKDSDGHIIGFMGIAERKVEMLFIHPESRGMGIGKTLLGYAIREKGVNAVDVNEQNPQAVGFYLHAGFKVVSRSATDGMGKPFPILSMEL